MKIFAGKWPAWVVLVVAIFTAASNAQARVTATVDRTDIAMGETLRLTLTANEAERPDEIDLSQLTKDFDILQRSSATSARIISGEQNVTRTLELELGPKRDGLLTVPALSYDGRRTTPIAIKVRPQPDVNLGDELVYFDAKVDQDEIYVQAQLILTVTLQQAINLDNRAISELDIPDTYVEPLEQKTYQRRISGRLWQVTELRYALFPQQSGALTIPPITFSGRELLPGRSLLGARLGRRIALASQAIKVPVKPVPASFPGSVWLPAKNLALSDRWSSPPGALTIGDSSTRTIEITADGLQGSQLPPLTSLMGVNGLSGLKFYPDQETVEQQEIAAGIQGYRLQSEALVATTEGSWTLPSLEVPWWNTETDSLEYARIPEVTITIDLAATSSVPTLESVEQVPPNLMDGDFSLINVWQLVAAAGWCLALIMAWLLRRRPRGPLIDQPHTPRFPAIGNRELVPLRLACSENNPTAAREALRLWGQCWLATDELPTLSLIAKNVDSELAHEIERLEAALWGDNQNNWRGNQLFGEVKRQGRHLKDTKTDELALYPLS